MAAALLLAVGAAGAEEVVLRDGTVVEVTSCRVTGSHVLLTLPDGRQVAYDITDVDPASLQGSASVPTPGTPTPAQPSLGGLASGLALEERASGSGIQITDADVEHLRAARGGAEPDSDAGDSDQNLPEGYTEGGGISLNNVELASLEEGSWRVSGEVVNRSRQVAKNVKIKLEVGGPTPATIDFDVTASLPPDERAVFEHTFRSELEPGQSQPSARFRVIWLQEETRREPTPPRYGQGGPPVPDVVAPPERPIH